MLGVNEAWKDALLSQAFHSSIKKLKNVPTQAFSRVNHWHTILIPRLPAGSALLNFGPGLWRAGESCRDESAETSVGFGLPQLFSRRYCSSYSRVKVMEAMRLDSEGQMLFYFRVEDRFPLSFSLPPQECHENRQGFPLMSVKDGKMQNGMCLIVERHVSWISRMSQCQCLLPSHYPVNLVFRVIFHQ